MSDKRATGPIQVFLIGFEKLEDSEQILAELRRVRKRGVIRLVDLLFIQKDKQGKVTSGMHHTDLSEADRERLGAIAGQLIGMQAAGLTETAETGTDAGTAPEREHGLSLDQLQELVASIPNDSSAAVLVIEHHWAARLQEAIAEAGGATIAQAMLSPDALLIVGEEIKAVIEAEEVIEAAEAIKYAAALEVAQVLAEAELIEEAAMAEAADAVASAMAAEDAAAEDLAETLVAAALIEEAALADTAEVLARNTAAPRRR